MAKEWDDVFGFGWEGVLDSARNPDFKARFVAEENRQRIQEIRHDLGMTPASVLVLCVDSVRSGETGAPSPSQVDDDVAFLRNKVLPGVRRILGYASVSVPIRGERLSSSPKNNPRASVLKRTPLLYPPQVSGLIRGLEDLVSRVDANRDAISRPRVPEPDRAETYFLRAWERRTLKLRRLLAKLGPLIRAARANREAEEAAIGDGKLTDRWNILDATRAHLEHRASVLESLLKKERRIRQLYGIGLFEVIFGRPIDDEAYEKRLARIAAANART
jgi:hypothetical protein